MVPSGQRTVVVRITRGKAAKGLPLPSYMTEGAAGMDLAAAVKSKITVSPGERVMVPTGLRLSVPSGYEMQIRPRSGLAIKHGVTVVNAPGTVDSDYRGEVKVLLINHGSDAWTLKRGDRIAQMVLAKVARVRWRAINRLEKTSRGKGGFGSSGRK